MNADVLFFCPGKGARQVSQKGKGFGRKSSNPRGTELKSKEQILKARHRKEKTMRRQQNGKGKGNKGKFNRRK